MELSWLILPPCAGALTHPAPPVAYTCSHHFWAGKPSKELRQEKGPGLAYGNTRARPGPKTWASPDTGLGQPLPRSLVSLASPCSASPSLFLLTPWHLLLCASACILLFSLSVPFSTASFPRGVGSSGCWWWGRRKEESQLLFISTSTCTPFLDSVSYRDIQNGVSVGQKLQDSDFGLFFASHLPS